MVLILSKTVLKFKIIHIWLFIAILWFCIVFVGNHQNYHCGAKYNYLRNKLWIDRIFFFSSYIWNWTNIAENCYAPQNESHTAVLRFLCVLKRARWKLTKNSHFVPWRVYLRKQRGIAREDFFSSNEWEKALFLEHQNEPHWAVHRFSEVLHCFNRNSPKTTIMGQKVAIREISSE